ncbi:hypothetical protein [Rhodobium gokarnense]|uniref:Uncharacterized protein n=1 Tax=Rhodobium gokarnense TaxID=364296 RepID=A0ABT3HII7_9HYPH|nr:hypothetical protein [Rhodobium gokarnense]MCW2310226.1 hypothetical protein [Rhodobium gokarnense]
MICRKNRRGKPFRAGVALVALGLLAMPPAVLLPSSPAAAAREGWTTKTLQSVSLDVPSAWTEAESSANELVLLEAEDGSGASITVIVDADVTDINDGETQIGTSSAVVAGQIARRLDWRAGSERGATIILSDPAHQGGQIALVLSAPQKRWNLARKTFRLALRSIKLTASAPETAVADEASAAGERGEDVAAADETSAPDEPAASTAATKLVTITGEGFSVKIPDTWQWREGGRGLTAYHDAIAPEGAARIRFGVLKEGGYGSIDEPYYQFVDGIRGLLSEDELTANSELEDGGVWHFREAYEGRAADGSDVTLDILLADRQRPAIAMATLAPADADAAMAKLLKEIAGSVAIDGAAKAKEETAEAPQEPEAAGAIEEAEPEAEETAAAEGPATDEEAETPSPQDVVAAAEPAAAGSAPPASTEPVAVSGEGFSATLPAGWTWRKGEAGSVAPYEAASADGKVLIRFAVLKPGAYGGGIDEPYYRFVEAMLTLMSDDVLTANSEVEDSDTWHFLEAYEGASQDGADVGLEVLLADKAVPAIAMATLAPVDLDDATADAVQAIADSVTLTGTPVATDPEAAEPPETGPEGEPDEPAAEEPPAEDRSEAPATDKRPDQDTASASPAASEPDAADTGEETQAAAPAPDQNASAEEPPAATTSPKVASVPRTGTVQTEKPAAAPADVAPIYVRKVEARGFALRVPDGWTIREDRGAAVESWRLRDKAWRAGTVPEGVFSAAVTVSGAKGSLDDLFAETKTHFATKVLEGGETLGEGTLPFGAGEMRYADIAGALDANGSKRIDAVVRLAIARRDGRLLVFSAFAPAANRGALDRAFSTDGLVAPLATAEAIGLRTE